MAGVRFSGLELEVELREALAPPAAWSRDSGQATPVAILWQAERPVAVVGTGSMTVARATARSLREPLVAAARTAGLHIALDWEARLWTLMTPPPRRAGARRGRGGKVTVLRRRPPPAD